MKQASFLLTGFEPFQGESINPSKEIVLSFQQNALIDTLILPVSYDRSWQLMQDQIELKNYQFILMLGQAAGRSKISLEKVALNLQDSSLADEDQIVRLDSQISETGPEAILSKLPLREWVAVLREKQRPVSLSLSAGAFVCNSLSYQLAECLQNENSKTESLFVHLPCLPDQVIGKNLPSQPLETMKASIQNLIELILL